MENCPLILEKIKSIPDYRKGNAIRHVLSDILMIGLLCILCNGNTYSAMYIFGRTHENLLKSFLQLPNGIPSQDTFEHVFAKLNPKTLSATFSEWINELKEAAIQSGRLIVSIDGKTLCGSRRKEQKPIHVVTAFASELHLVLGELATDKKSNEITAIPKLLEMFCQKGMIITIDAMGTQTEIAETIIEKQADYVFSVKENQPNLYREVANHLEYEVITENKEELQELKDAGLYERTIEKGHGRIETRECFICNDISNISVAPNWKGFAGFGVILSKREVIGKNPTLSCEYFMYSLEDTSATELLHLKRHHWAIENNLHWTLDVVFKEDDSRITIDNAPENINIFRKQAMQLLKDDDSFDASMTAKRYRCSLDIAYALKVVGVK